MYAHVYMTEGNSLVKGSKIGADRKDLSDSDAKFADKRVAVNKLVRWQLVRACRYSLPRKELPWHLKDNTSL